MAERSEEGRSKSKKDRKTMIMHELIFLLAFLCMVSSYRSFPKARCSLNGLGRLSPFGAQSSDWVDLTADGAVKKKVLTPGTDKLVEAGDIIAASFSGFVKGQSTPFVRNDKAKFTLKDGTAIKGWDIAVGSMKVGEKALFSVSSSYGYGAKGVDNVIPPNADLEFQINVLATLGNELQPESLFQKDLNVDPFLAQTPEAIQAEYDKLQVSGLLCIVPLTSPHLISSTCSSVLLGAERRSL